MSLIGMPTEMALSTRTTVQAPRPINDHAQSQSTGYHRLRQRKVDGRQYTVDEQHCYYTDRLQLGTSMIARIRPSSQQSTIA